MFSHFLGGEFKYYVKFSNPLSVVPAMPCLFDDLITKTSLLAFGRSVKLGGIFLFWQKLFQVVF